MRDSKAAAIIFSVVLVVLTYIAFSAILDNGFVEFDDGLYVTENPRVLSGLNRDSVKWAFQTTETGNWIPLTWLSHMLNVELFGTNPRWHHATDLVLHALNAVLLFVIFHKTTRLPWAAFLVALLFAVHPLRVESVAWVSERKDTLSAFFGFLSLLSYVSFAQDKKRTAYLLCGLFLILGLMSKAMLITWPFVFLLMDYWPLSRFSQALAPELSAPKRFANLLIEKLPFFIIIAVFSVVAYYAQAAGGSVSDISSFPLYYRVGNCIISYAAYLKQMFYPVALGVLYPLDPRDITSSKIVFAAGLLFALTAIFFLLRRRFPYLIACWLWFLGTLLPVSGLVQIGNHSMADRYTYIPGIGIVVMLSFAAVQLAKRGRIAKIAVSTMAGAVICALVFLTWIQTAYWKNTFALYAHTLQVTQDNYIIHLNYGSALAKAGEFDLAIEQFRKASAVFPRAAEPLQKLASVCIAAGDYPKALDFAQRACRLTEFKDVSAIKTLLRVLEADPSLEKSLSPDFVSELNARLKELNLSPQ